MDLAQIALVTTNTTTALSGVLPSQLLPYGSIIGLVLLFVDGVLFGIAVKKALVSVVLVVVALMLAAFVGVTVPFVSTGTIFTHIVNILTFQAAHIGLAFYALPIFFIVGFAIGVWRG
ncbi:MAG: hypothetical protein JRM90_07400 [Nitrososphaerota archaeon]|nr:hypothetical protein [Nitrososphaerota archaeon]